MGLIQANGQRTLFGGILVAALVLTLYIGHQFELHSTHQYVTEQSEHRNTASSQGSFHDKSTNVVILSYMRSGSSLMGKLFDENPSALYVFEPLSYLCEDAIPQFEQLVYPDGSIRFPESSCTSLGTEVIRSYITCDLSEIDFGTLTQGWMTSGIKTREFYFCWSRFGTESCIYNFTQVCNQASVRAIKTIRTRLKDLAPLLETVPNLKVVNLVRDPRGIIESRFEMGEYYHRSVTKTALQICGDMLRDVTDYKQITINYPRRILQVRYEDLADNPLHVSRAIYRFLGLEMPNKVVKWIEENTNAVADDGTRLGTTRANSSQTANKWRDSISWHLVQSIDSKCASLLNFLGYLQCDSLEMLRNGNISLRWN